MTVKFKIPSRLKKEFDREKYNSREDTEKDLAIALKKQVIIYLKEISLDDFIRQACDFSRFYQYEGEGIIQGDRVYF